MKYASFALMCLTAGVAGGVIGWLVPEQPEGMVLSFVVGAIIGIIWPK